MLKREADLSEWQRLSEEWEQSGLKQREYCKGKGISWRAFSQGRTELIMKGLAKPCYKRRKPEINQEAMGFVPVSFPMESVLSQESLGACKARFIEINLPHGIVMRIPT
jgi:hypothetical protein